MIRHAQFLLFVVLLLVLALSSPLFALSSDAAPCPAAQEAKLRVALVSTFGDEAALTQKAMSIESSCTLVGRTAHLGTLEGHDVVLIVSGGSTANSALTLQALIDHFHLSAILVSGISGAVNPDAHIGDVFVPAQWSEYQNVLYAREQSDGTFAIPGWFPKDFGGEHDGARFSMPVSATSVNGTPDKDVNIPWVAMDANLLKIAQGLQVDLLRCAPDTQDCLTDQPVLHVGGNGVSGDAFVDNTKFRTLVWQTWKADTLDMESASFAHDAYVNQIPILIFRSASDLAGGSSHANEIDTFGHLAALNASQVMIDYLKLLPISS